MALYGLKKFEKIYPLFIEKFEDFTPAPDNADITVKINSLISYLNSVGRLTNDVVSDWNNVMTWSMNEGLKEATEDKIDDLISSGKLPELVEPFVNEITTLAEEQISLIETNQVATKVEINEVTTQLATVENKVKKLFASPYEYENYKNGDDWTIPLQMALDSLSEGGTLYIPDDTFNFDVLYANTPRFKIKGTGTLKNGKLVIGNTIKEQFFNFEITGITFENETFTIGSFDNNFIELQNARKGSIHNCRFVNCNAAIFIIPLNDAKFQHVNKIRIYDNYFENVDYAFHSVRNDEGHLFPVADIHFKNNMIEPANISHIYGKGIDGIHITGNTMFFQGWSGQSLIKRNNIYLEYVDWVIIQNNNLFEAGESAIHLHSFRDVNISTNNIAWCGQRTPSHGIKLSHGSLQKDEYCNGVISLNTIVYPSHHGISVEDFVGYISITGNTIRKAGNPTTYYGVTDLGTITHFGINVQDSAKHVSIIGNNSPDNDNYIKKENLTNYFSDNNDLSGGTMKMFRNKDITTNETIIDVTKLDKITMVQPSPTTITNFTNGIIGKELTIIAYNTNTTIKNSNNILLKNNVDVSLPVRGIIKLLYNVDRWFEVGRNF